MINPQQSTEISPLKFRFRILTNKLPTFEGVLTGEAFKNPEGTSAGLAIDPGTLDAPLHHSGRRSVCGHRSHSRVDVSNSTCCQHTHGSNEQHHAHSHSTDSSKEHYGGSIIDLPDIERLGSFEQVVLSVEGMGCSGCGTNLRKALEATPGVSRVQVNFFTGKVDFQLNTTIKSVDDAIRTAERATGFHCARQSSDGHAIDLLIPQSAIAELEESNIPGLLDILPLYKNTMRVLYDPELIGARALVDRVGHLSKGLAPPKGDMAVLHGRKCFCEQLIKSILAAALTIPVVVLAWGATAVEGKQKALVSLALATLVQLIAVSEFYIPAIAALVRNRVVEMDMLVVISITAAYVYSIVAFGFRMAGDPLEMAELFETSTLLITLVLFGRLIAAYARARAIEAVSLRSLQPAKALITEGGSDREIDSRLLQFGDKFKLFPHSRIPTDGLVLEGQSEVDESMLTGENLPVKKQPGMSIIAGTVNGGGTLTAQLTRLPGRNTVTDIAGLVEEASRSKPRIQDLADRVASYFVPIVSGMAIIVFVTWTVVDLKGRHASRDKAVADAITYTVAVLAVSCPCALGLAVPMLLVVAAGTAARGGVVVKSTESTVRSRKITDVVFDKTGTITAPDLDVVDHEFFTEDICSTLAITKALVQDNEHPVSIAVNRLLKSKNVVPAIATGVKSIPGDGVIADHGDAIVKAGSPTWTLSDGHPIVAKAVSRGLTVLSVTSDDVLLALFTLKAQLRGDANSVINDLHRRGIAVHLVSGDQQIAVETVALEVGIPTENVAAQRSPAEKRSYVSRLIAEDKIVLFCGDGTNDAVAVAQADVGVQIGGSLLSSDVTRSAADVILLSGLGGIPYMLDISRYAFRRIVFNFAWAGIYNTLATLLAAGAFVTVRIPPAYAGLGELVSVLPVVLVAMTMLLHKPPKGV